MTLVWLLLLAAPAPDAAWEEADGLGALVRAERDPAKRAAALTRALEAYDALLAARPKDRKLVPRIRRRRASLLKACGLQERALAEYEATANGPSRRKDRARAWREAGELLARMDKPARAETYLRRAIDEYGDIVAERAKALLALGSLLAKREEDKAKKEAERAWREITRRCRDETKTVIAAYDRLALLAIESGDAKAARKWLEECVGRYRKRAARDDKRGRYLARLLGAMKAPAALTAPR